MLILDDVNPGYMQSRYRRLWLHILVILVLLLMPIIDAPSPQPMSLLLAENPYLGIDIVVHGLCIGFGYLNYFLLVPYLYFRRQRLVYFFIAVLCFVLMCFVPQILSRISFVPFFEDQVRLRIHTIVQTRHIFYLFVMIFLLSLTTRVYLRLSEMEKEKSLAEIRYLKAQINPHFLFNTLNSIYSLIQINPSAAGKSLLKMSNIMRYVLSASETTFEPLKQAIGYLEDFIGLQKERFRDTIGVHYTFSGDPGDLRIASLLLVPFIENAFKYGVDPEFNSQLSVDIRVTGHVLELSVINTDFSLHQSGIAGTGIGILNTKNRLELLYAGRYQLNISNKDGLFRVKLRMELE